MPLPLVDPNGRIYHLAGGTPVAWANGIGYTAIGQMCTTVTPGANDQYVGGLRLDPVGRVVVAALSGAQFFNSGLPSNSSNDTESRQVDVVPIAADAYAPGGIRVSATGGVHFTTATPP